MAQRDAAVRLTLNAGSFAGGMRDLSRQASSVGQQIGRAMSGPMKAGFKAGRDAAGALMNDIKGALKMATTLGGAIGAGAGIKSAIEMRSVYADLAFNISKVGKEAMTWQQIQGMIEPVAKKTSRSSQEMAAAFKTVFEATGDAEYSKTSLESIADAANATGYSVDHLANAAQIMQRKFGASAKDMPEMMARFIEKVGVGGAGIDGLGPKFALMAGEAAEAGMKGADGVSKLLGVMIALDSRVGEKAAPGLKMMLQTLKSGSSTLKTLEKAGGIKFEADSGAFDKIRQMLTGKGRVAIEAALTGESRTVFDELAKPFDEAMRAAKAGGATTKEATEAGLAAFDRAMNEAGKSSLTAAKIAEEAQKRQEEPQRKLQAAMETFYQSFTKPEMLSAIDELAKSLPKLAEGLAKIVEFVTRNPALAGGLYVGGRVGGAVAGAAMGQLPQLALTGGKSVGKEIATSFGAQVAAQGKWAAIGNYVGAAAGIAIAAVIAYELGKEGIDQVNKLGSEAGKEKFAADIEAFNLQNKIKRQGGAATPADLAKAKELEATLTKTNTIGSTAVGGTGGKVLDFLLGTGGTGMAAQMLFSSSEKSSAGTGTKAGMEESRATIEFLRNLGNAARTATTELQKVKGATSGSNGLPPAPGSEPGAG